MFDIKQYDEGMIRYPLVLSCKKEGRRAKEKEGMVVVELQLLFLMIILTGNSLFLLTITIIIMVIIIIIMVHECNKFTALSLYEMR